MKAVSAGSASTLALQMKEAENMGLKRALAEANEKLRSRKKVKVDHTREGECMGVIHDLISRVEQQAKPALRTFQQSIVDIIDTEDTAERRIHWIYSQAGNEGKNKVLVPWLQRERGALAQPEHLDARRPLLHLPLGDWVSRLLNDNWRLVVVLTKSDLAPQARPIAH